MLARLTAITTTATLVSAAVIAHAWLVAQNAGLR